MHQNYLFRYNFRCWARICNQFYSIRRCYREGAYLYAILNTNYRHWTQSKIKQPRLTCVYIHTIENEVQFTNLDGDDHRNEFFTRCPYYPYVIEKTTNSFLLGRWSGIAVEEFFLTIARRRHHSAIMQINLSRWKNCFKWLTSAGQVFCGSLFPVSNFCFLYMHFGLFTLWEEETWSGAASARSWLQSVVCRLMTYFPIGLPWRSALLMSRAACACVSDQRELCGVIKKLRSYKEIMNAISNLFVWIQGRRPPEQSSRRGMGNT